MNKRREDFPNYQLLEEKEFVKVIKQPLEFLAFYYHSILRDVQI